MKKLLIGIFAGFLLVLPLGTFAEEVDCSLTAPESCYTKPASGNIQHLKPNSKVPHCLNNGRSLNLPAKVYDKLVENGDSAGFTKNLPNSVNRLQNLLNKSKWIGSIEKVKYCNPNSLIDGKYGNCTEAVFNEYLKKSCKAFGEIHLKITDDEGINLSNVKITGISTNHTLTDGKYIFKKVPSETYNFTFEKDGYETKTVSIAVTAPNKIKKEIKLKKIPPLPKDVRIHGEVVDSKYKAIPNIIIDIKKEGEKKGKTINSGSEFVLSDKYPFEKKEYTFTFSNNSNKYIPKIVTANIDTTKGYDFGKIILYTKCEMNEFDADCLFPAWASESEKTSKRQEIRGIYGKNNDGEISGDKSALSIIPNIINILLKFVSPIVVIMFIFAGIRFIYAGSDEDDITKAKDFFIYAGIGLAFIIMSYTLMKVLYFFLK